MKLILDKKDPKPTYRKICDSICNAISTGQLAASEKLPTEYELASILKVNRLTVSKGYDTLRQMRVVDQRPGRGTFVAEDVAAVLGLEKRRRLRNVAFILPGANLEHVPSIYRFLVFDFLVGILRYFEGQFVNICPLGTESLPMDDPQALRQRFSAFDGLIVVSNSQLVGMVQQAMAAGLPCVGIESGMTVPGMPRVYYDRKAAMSLAVNQLVNRGYRRIGYLGMDDRLMTPSKVAVFEQCLANHGLSLQPKDFYPADAAVGSAIAAAHRLLASGDMPQALFVATDYNAIETISVLKAAGKQVPRDIGVVSYDDIPEAAQFQPALTTVHTPRVEIGFAVAQMLSQWLPDQPAPADRVLQPHIVVRDSLDANHVARV